MNIFSNIKGDFFGGLTAGIVALPLALAFGVSSGLGPEAGLYGAIFVAFFAAAFGGTPTQISGPTAPMTAVSMLIVAGMIQEFDGNVAVATPYILTVFLLAGLMLIGLGLVGLGKYIKYIPYPVVSGFMTAIGLMIIITQIAPMVGYYPEEDVALVNRFKPQAEELLLEKILREEAGEGILVLENFQETINRGHEVNPETILDESVTLAKKYASGVVGSFKTIGRAFQQINHIELILGLATIFLVYGFKRITKVLPSSLVALVVVSGIAYWLQSQGTISYRPISKIPSGLPQLRLDIFSNFSIGAISPFIISAITLALLGAIDSLLTSVVADNMTKTRHNSKQELIGQGIGNSIAAIFGGIPGAGATIRTVVNIQAGAKTKLSGMIAGAFLLVILLALGPVASIIPQAVLAGLLVTVGFGVMDYKGLKAFPKMIRSEQIILVTVLLLATFWNLVYAVGIGLILASLYFMKAMADLSIERSKITTLGMTEMPSEGPWPDEEKLPKKLKEEVFVKHLYGPIFFGNTSDFTILARQVPSTASHVVLRMDRVPHIDQSGLYALEDVLLELHKRDIIPLIVGLNPEPEARMTIIGIVPELIPENHLFETFDECLHYINENVTDVY